MVRFGVFGKNVARIVALSAAMIVCAPLASAQAASSVSGSSGGWSPRVTPFRHAVTSGEKPSVGTSNTASPWTPLARSPGFAPGTMLLESDGTVLVHREPGNAGGTTDWYRLTPDKTGSYVNGTWSKIARDAGRL